MAESGIIESPRLNIVNFTGDHITDKYIAWLNDKELTRYSRHRYTKHTKKSCEDYLKSFQETPNFFWAIIAKDNTYGHIGNINAYVDLVHTTADIGILIGEKSIHGKGFGLEAWMAVCDFLLEKQHIRKVTGGTLSCNKPMIRIMEKANMVPDGRRVRHRVVDGKAVDEVYFARFRHNGTLREDVRQK